MVIPSFEQIMSWLDEAGIGYYQCEHCQALHIKHIQSLNDVYDAKIDFIDDILYYTLIAEVRPSAVPTLMTELSQINAASPIIKAYLDIQDDSSPKLVLLHSVNCGEGLSVNQFSLFLLRVEEDALQVINEVKNCDLLAYVDQDNNDNLSGKDLSTYH
ncbi:YbjN domain-containing protein [Zophobihabitans entericus]|uniref:YbjN domain-containing protein n=1 Tax=Zophobihabitans entericus TaxID=1635327 RepID=A0A6G9IBM0_9GAMM|nr:YbjN domain-containing protein [Zophobihabitans entericus]QIQ21219.1 YbjN domain-containing protein [Zophobihabitans entericus]